MRPIGLAVMRTGLVDHDTLSELRRWGLPVQEVDSSSELLTQGTDVVHILQDAMEGGEQVRVQDTDLDIVQRWLNPANQVAGKLVIRTLDDKRTSVSVKFCWTVMHEAAIPWRSESISDLMLDGDTHLQYTDKDGVRHKLYFADVRELYVGDTKAFLVCSVLPEVGGSK